MNIINWFKEDWEIKAVSFIIALVIFYISL
jgi:hypothetical protein